MQKSRIYQVKNSVAFILLKSSLLKYRIVPHACVQKALPHKLQAHLAMFLPTMNPYFMGYFNPILFLYKRLSPMPAS